MLLLAGTPKSRSALVSCGRGLSILSTLQTNREVNRLGEIPRKSFRRESNNIKKKNLFHIKNGEHNKAEF